MTSRILHRPGTWMFQGFPFHRPLIASLSPQNHIAIAMLEQEANIPAFPLSIQDIHIFHITITISLPSRSCWQVTSEETGNGDMTQHLATGPGQPYSRLHSIPRTIRYQSPEWIWGHFVVSGSSKYQFILSHRRLDWWLVGVSPVSCRAEHMHSNYLLRGYTLSRKIYNR